MSNGTGMAILRQGLPKVTSVTGGCVVDARALVNTGTAIVELSHNEPEASQHVLYTV